MYNAKKSISFSVVIFLLLGLVTPSAFATEEQDQTDVKDRVLQLQQTDAGLPGGVTEQKGRVGTILARLFDNNGKIKSIFLDRLFTTLSGGRLVRYDSSTSTFVDSTIRDNGARIGIGGGVDNSYIANITGDVNITGTVTGATPTAGGHLATKAYVDTNSGVWSLNGSSEAYYNTANVGIGNNNPSNKLHVTDSGAGLLLLEGNTSGAAGAMGSSLELSSNTETRGQGTFMTVRDNVREWFAGVPYTGLGYSIGYDATGGQSEYKANSMLFVANTGNVGIGTSGPGERLTVAGRLNITTDPNSGDDVGDRDYNDARYLNVGEAIGGDIITDGTIDSSEIEDNTLTAADLANGSVAAAEIQDGSVRTQEIANNTITETDISDSFKARDADRLDNIDSSSFVRSDADDNISGNHNFWGTNTSGSYASAPIEVREVNTVGAAQSSEAYAPAITWHWGGRVQGQLSLESDGVFHFRDGATHTTLENVNANSFLENGTALASKYLGIGAKANDSDLIDGINGASLLRSDIDDTFLGKLSVGSTNNRRAGIYGTYDATKIGHIWSMGTAYQIPQDGSDFGNLYGFAYKHTNNPTGGTMASGHQAVWTQNGTPSVAIGSHIWTSGEYRTDGVTVVNSSGWVIGDRILQGSVDSSEIQDNTLTAADLAANSVGNSELIATPTFTNVISNDPTAANHAATKSYVDTLVQGIVWKGPSATSAVATHGACDGSKEGWATYNNADNVIYICNGSAWVNIGSTATIPYATTTTAGRVQLAGALNGTWNNVGLAANSVGHSQVVANSLLASDLAPNSVSTSEIVDGGVRTQEILDNTITASDIATSGVATDEILNNTITETDISDSFVARDSNKLSKQAAYTWIGDLNGTPRSMYDSGNLGFGMVNSTTNNAPVSYGMMMNIPSHASSQDGGAGQIIFPYSSSYTSNGNPVFRGGTYNNGGWSAWKTFMDKDWADTLYIGIGDAIPGDTITDGTIDSSEIEDNTLTAADLAANSVGTSEVAGNSLTAADLAANSVAASEIAANAVGNSELIDAPTITNLNVASGDGNGVRFWSSGSYRIAMGNAANYHYGPVTGYSIKSTMNNDSSRGWTWGVDGSTPVIAFNTQGNAQFAGNIQSLAYLYSSDETLKENITTLETPLETISTLRGVDFSWKENGKKDVGFIAQEVETVLPELVHTDKTTGLKSVQYGNIVAILVEGVKEILQEIKGIIAENNAQQQEIDELKIELQELKELLEK